MSRCISCGLELPEGDTFCSGCGARLQAAPEPAVNPYHVTEAVIDAQPVLPEPDDTEAHSGYNIRFGVSASITETFNIWSASLGKLIVISLIPMIPAVLVITALLIAFFVVMATDLATLWRGIESGNFGNLSDSFGNMVGFGIAFAVVLILIMVLTIPSIVGQFKIMDEKTRYGEHKTGVWQAYWGAFKHTPPLIGFALLVYIILGIASVPGILLFKIPVLSVVYFLALLVVASIAGIRISLVVPIMVIEELPLFTAVARSNEMARGNTWTIMGIWGLMVLVLFGIMIVLSLVNFVPLIGQLVNMFSQLALTPLQMACFFAIYAGLKSPRSSF